MIFTNKKSFVFLLIFLTFIKIIFSFFYGDIEIDNEWNKINQNLVEFGEFSFYEIDGQRIPSVYMPPLYPYILYFFFKLNFEYYYTIKLVLIFQCIFSSTAIFIFKLILEKYFSKTNSSIISLIYFLFPLNFYAASQISSVSIQVSLFIFYIYFILNFRLNFILLAICSSLLILMRGEFWLLYLLSLLFLFVQNIKYTKKILVSLLISLIVISPVLIKNYKIFNQIILTKSFGYNLWRGNTEPLNLNGNNFPMTDTFMNDFKNSGNDILKFELYFDNYFLKDAKSNIYENPLKYFKHYLRKFFAYSIFNFDSNYPNYFNPIIIIPEILLSIFAILGIGMSIFKKKNFLLLLLVLFYLALIPVFFILPRYKLFILPLYFIFASQFLFYFSNIFSKKQ